MKLITSILFTLAVTIFQVESYSKPHELDYIMQKHKMLKEETGSYASTNVFDNVKIAVKKVRSCSVESKMELINLAFQTMSDFDACINGTRKIADILSDGMDWFDFMKDVIEEFYDLFKNIFGCYSQTGLVNKIECTIQVIQDEGEEIDNNLTYLKHLVSTLGDHIDEFISDFKDCLFGHKELFLEAAMKKINKC